MPMRREPTPRKSAQLEATQTQPKGATGAEARAEVLGLHVSADVLLADEAELTAAELLVALGGLDGWLVMPVFYDSGDDCGVPARVEIIRLNIPRADAPSVAQEDDVALLVAPVHRAKTVLALAAVADGENAGHVKVLVAARHRRQENATRGLRVLPEALDVDHVVKRVLHSGLLRNRLRLSDEPRHVGAARDARGGHEGRGRGHGQGEDDGAEGHDISELKQRLCARGRAGPG
mmetsp:Transcript_45227/g.141746  ORF Transcript_45227/g.141746 Transcript_45227/m.141746 type:complete len:234 (-) Transcript_45227:78-779(-)